MPLSGPFTGWTQQTHRRCLLWELVMNDAGGFALGILEILDGREEIEQKFRLISVRILPFTYSLYSKSTIVIRKLMIKHS